MVGNTAFIYLTAFSKTGGIEQFNKNVMASLQEVNFNTTALSLHDTEPNTQYIQPTSFKGFGGNRIIFLFSCLMNARKYNRLLIGHINLAFAAFIIKKINPRIQLILFAHGIEVWKPQKGFAAWLLNNVHQIFAVSHFTKNKLLNNNLGIPATRIQILPNALDPLFKYPDNFNKPGYLQKRYGIASSDKLILTIARLSSSEQYKGYDLIIKILSKLNKQFTREHNQQPANIKYMIAGKADAEELKRIQDLIKQEQLTDNVILTGFIDEAELVDHYLLADLFVLPSVGEGFGIVLIEAMACGLNVIAGNKDGSVDALVNGELGILIDPNDSMQLSNSISHHLNGNKQAIDLQRKSKAYFSFEVFKLNLLNVLNMLTS